MPNQHKMYIFKIIQLYFFVQNPCRKHHLINNFTLALFPGEDNSFCFLPRIPIFLLLLFFHIFWYLLSYFSQSSFEFQIIREILNCRLFTGASPWFAAYRSLCFGWVNTTLFNHIIWMLLNSMLETKRMWFCLSYDVTNTKIH